MALAITQEIWEITYPTSKQVWPTRIKTVYLQSVPIQGSLIRWTCPPHSASDRCIKAANQDFSHIISAPFSLVMNKRPLTARGQISTTRVERLESITTLWIQIYQNSSLWTRITESLTARAFRVSTVQCANLRSWMIPQSWVLVWIKDS